MEKEDFLLQKKRFPNIITSVLTSGLSRLLLSF